MKADNCVHKSPTTRSIVSQSNSQHYASLTFQWPSWYLNLNAWFMKNLLFYQKNIKLWHKWHFVEIITQTMQDVLKCSKFHYCLNIQNEFIQIFFLCVYMYVNTGHLKVKEYFNIILPGTTWYSKSSLPSRYPDNLQCNPQVICINEITLI